MQPSRAKIGHSDLVARLKKALKLGGDTHTVEDVLEAIRDGRMQSFAHNNALVVTEIVQAPRKKYLNVFLAVSDDISDVMAIQPSMVEFARSQGCDWVQTHGRHGWQKVLPKHGWKPTHILFVLGTHNGKISAN